MPKILEFGVLYVSEEFNTAAHLCPCGCGSKIRTPLGPTEWSVQETKSGPTLYPSVGNWQQECQSHYWIYNGKVLWEDQWTEEQILGGREQEQARRVAYYESIYKSKHTPILRIIYKLTKLFRKKQ